MGDTMHRGRHQTDLMLRNFRGNKKTLHGRAGGVRWMIRSPPYRLGLVIEMMAGVRNTRYIIRIRRPRDNHWLPGLGMDRVGVWRGYNAAFPICPADAMDCTHNPSPTIDDTPRPWLRAFCLLTILATFALIAIGGHVTSNDVGLAVPDGFTTFGHFTLTAPLEKWWHDFGTRWEHSHRLKGNVVGMMTIGMAVWLLLTQRARPWLRYSGLVMLGLVISQGIMGALRVSEVSLTLAFVHGIGGQLILCSWVVIAVALGPSWLSRLGTIAKRQAAHTRPKLKWAVRVLLVLLLVQLTLGSAVRHFKADKALPDFPLHLGQVIPPMSQDAVDQAYVTYFADRMGVALKDSGVANRTPQGEIVVTAGDVHLHFAHRLGAYVVFAFGITVAVWAIRRAGDRGAVIAPALVFMALLGTQVALGVMTVLSEIDPFTATLHQATGAALIAVATWLAVRIHLAEYAATPVIADTKDSAAAPRPAASPNPGSPATA